jgi:hypothetical protein
VAETKGDGEIIRFAFQVAYDGKHLHDAHSMDVQELAPALLSFGRLVRETNSQLNGNKADVKVLVTSNFEHKCFNINFEIVQTVLHHISTFLQSEEVKTARGILVDLGIIGGSSGLGLFGYLKWKKGNKIASTADTDKQGIVIVQLGNGNTAEVNSDAIRLADNSKIRAALEGILSPLGTDGIKKISFRQDDQEVVSLDDDGAKEILSTFALPTSSDDDEVSDELPDTVTAWLRVYSPVYDEKAGKWRFYYGDSPIYADIADTTIARDALKRGGALVNDLYKVKMEVRQHLTPAGNVRLDYKVIEVLDFRPAPQQAQML